MLSRRKLVLVVLIVTAALILLSITRSGPPPNIIVISIDALRADRLHCYGYPKEISPNIDAFAEDSSRFLYCYSQATWTYPSHASMLTGLLPSQHGLINEHRRVPPFLHTIMNAVRAKGYTTIGVTDGAWMGSHFGWQDHFDRFDELKRYKAWNDKSDPHPGLLEDRIEAFFQIVESVEEPFFAFIHTYEVHDWVGNDERNEIFADKDYRGIMYRNWHNMCKGVIKEGIVPNEADLRYMKARYDGAIFNMDQAFGTFISTLKEKDLYDESIIILTSDHGEAFGERGLFGHGKKPYNFQNRVPLIIRDGKHKRTVERPVALSDIPATIVGSAGLDAKFSGRSLFETSDRLILTETMDMRAFVFDNVKYLSLGNQTFGYRLDDLEEQENLLQMEKTIQQPLAEEAREELKALGYLQ